MNMKNWFNGWMLRMAVAFSFFWGLALLAGAHCDTLDGPVIKEAQAALEKGDVTRTLKWVKPKNEGEIRAAFKKTMAVRGAGPEARELADHYFFETLVRVHRAGEGAPYTGIKPAGIDPGEAVTAADKALESGSPDKLVRLVTDRAADGLRQKHARLIEAKKKADQSVEAGREYVAAYVDFVHYAERLYLDAASQGAHHGEAEEGAKSHAEHHEAAADKHHEAAADKHHETAVEHSKTEK